MAFVQRAFVMFLVMAALEVSFAAVYKVGDSSGWTTLGNFNYTKWTLNKNFHVGDTILFEYSKQFHNVMEVSHADYQACNVSSPIGTYATGNDSITINKTGHHYFLCGFPGHCLSGQKVDILATKTSAMAPSPILSMSPSNSPSKSPPLGTSPGAPGPSPNSAPHPSKGLLGKLVLGVAVFTVGVYGFAY